MTKFVRNENISKDEIKLKRMDYQHAIIIFTARHTKNNEFDMQC